MFSIKYRGKQFIDLVGHTKIINEMLFRSKNRDFPEVMIFEGDSGTGKTTLAFIIAKLLNCKNPLTVDNHLEPCNNCLSCLDINEERFSRDVSFFDASSMGKDDVLKLNEIVDVYPLNDKNKILIIDEAQELSKSGKGSTLKLLEKKRSNVYFILCTMDTQALGTAVKRRGQTYKFKYVNPNDIADYLIRVIQSENLFDSIPEEFLTKGVFILAEGSGGSPGKAVADLERCLMGNIYTEQEIIRELGLISEKTSIDLLTKLLMKDKSIFPIFKDIDLKDFYFKSNKILQEYYVYYHFNFIDEEWKLKNIERLKSLFSEAWDLIESFNKVQTDPYFKESSFYYEIFKYFDCNVPIITPVIPERPKRVPIRNI